jgi:hypothetical protein
VAEVLEIRSTRVKLRGPWAVFFLALVTLGIYYLVWYYKINRELRDAGGLDVSPGVALLAITLGALIIVPPFVSVYRTFRRIRTAQEAVGLPDPALPWVGFLLFVLAYVFLPFELVYAQSNLNRLWRRMVETEGQTAPV